MREQPFYHRFLQTLPDDAKLDFEDVMWQLYTKGRNPASFLSFLGNGSYKEAYSLNARYVIKFASINNDTEDERYISEASKREGLGDIFLDSWYFKLPETHYIELTQKEEIDADYYDEDDRISYLANYIIIQPIVEVADDDWSNNFISIYLPHITWSRDLEKYYDTKTLTNLDRFLALYAIFDIRADNVGYYEGRPVIFDWLSKEIKEK